MSVHSILLWNSHHEGQAFSVCLSVLFLLIIIFREHDGEKHHEGMKEYNSLCPLAAVPAITVGPGSLSSYLIEANA